MFVSVMFSFLIFICSGNQNSYHRYILFFFVNILFIINFIFLGFIFSLFFTNPNTAGEIIKLVNLVSNFASVFLNVYHQPFIGKMFRFLPYFPYWSSVFDDSFDDDHNLKNYFNIPTKITDEPSISPLKNFSILSLLIQLIIYPLLFIYLKGIVKSERDMKKSFFFFLKFFKKKNGVINRKSFSTLQPEDDMKTLVKNEFEKNYKCKIINFRSTIRS